VVQALSALPPGHRFTVPSNLFAKISDDTREAMEARFAGS
jgi:methionyl-tRNA synthetase